MFASIILLLVLAIAAVAACIGSGQHKPADTAVLRHTISVNLRILEGELAELEPLASAPPSTPAKEEAKALLAVARASASNISGTLAEAHGVALEEMLGSVFAAMNRSTTARKLLNACRPSQ